MQRLHAGGATDINASFVLSSGYFVFFMHCGELGLLTDTHTISTSHTCTSRKLRIRIVIRSRLAKFECAMAKILLM